MAYIRAVKKLIIISFLVAAGLPCLAGPFTPEYMDITVNGEVRNFGYYVPDSYDPSTPTPLLFMFHGAGGNNSEASGGSAENGYYAWQSSADENGFIVLFPKKECCFGFNLWSLSSDSVDLDFVDDMISWTTNNYHIRTTHIFTTGHSYGAYFSYCVARWRSDDIAAFGEHSGGISNIPVPTLASGPMPRLNAILLHAVNDGIVNYSGTQNLYDQLVANGHNVYNDGIIEVAGWGPDNHRYRKAHNQTQWDFFMASAPALYEVIYNANGATDGTAPAIQIKTHDLPWTLATNSGNLVKTGCTFAGWNTAADGNGIDYAPGASYTGNAALTLYAKWSNDDADNDGIPDAWEIAHGLNISINDASADNDRDGADNYAEFVADTGPTNSMSVFQLRVLSSGGVAAVSWDSSSNRVYTLWYAINPLNTNSWTPVSQATNMLGTGGAMVYTSPVPAPAGFYRASVSLNN